MDKQDRKEKGADILWELAGCFIMATGLYCFWDAARVAPGGVSGLAIMAGYLWGAPVGTSAFILNIPLLLLAWKYLGKGFALRTLRVTFFSAVMLDGVVGPFIPAYAGDRLLGSVFGGVLTGTGLGLIFLRGASTGGTDILSMLVRKKYPHVPLGRMILFIDCGVLALSIPVFGDMESALLGLAALFCQSRVIDGLIYGNAQGELFLIVSGRAKDIAGTILEEMGRGVTYLKGSGAYTGKEQDVIVCAARKREYGALRKIIWETDPEAFVVVGEAREILGRGFSGAGKENRETGGNR